MILYPEMIGIRTVEYGFVKLILCLLKFFRSSQIYKCGCEMLQQKNIRAAIDKFQKLVEAIPQVEFPIKHYFSKGVYAREMFLPKGHFCVGKIHKHENLMILSQGDV